MSLRVIFAGTPEFSSTILERLLSPDFEVIAVLTQPDRRAGRGRKMQASPVKQLAQQHKIPVYQPQSLKRSDMIDWSRLQADVMVVVAYGLILPQTVLDQPRLGCVNVHASLLPRWRGAAPIQRAIEAGDSETGVCIMQMEAGLDTGPVLARQSVAIANDDNAQTLHDKLANIGAALLPVTLRELAAGSLAAQPQPIEGISYAHKLQKSEVVIDWTTTATEIERRVRAFNPWPVAQALHGDTVLRIWSASINTNTNPTAKVEPGTITAVTDDAITVETGDGGLLIHSLQRTGGKRISIKHFLNGYSIAPGDRLI